MLSYIHTWHDGGIVEWSPGKAVCVGRNYAAHAEELNNPVPQQPLLFMKPATAMQEWHRPIALPQGQGACHFETEIAVLIGRETQSVSADAVPDYLAGVGLALDLTLRELQNELKEKGHPWERAKAFDGACPMSRWVPIDEVGSIEALSMRLEVNGEVRQQGRVAEMLWPIARLVSEISEHFTLQPGDVVLTGTPQGVGPLENGMVLTGRLDCGDQELIRVETQVL